MSAWRVGNHRLAWATLVLTSDHDYILFAAKLTIRYSESNFSLKVSACQTNNNAHLCAVFTQVFVVFAMYSGFEMKQVRSNEHRA